MAQAMQQKYDKYWKKSNIALVVVCFLDPRYKKRLIEYFLQRIYKDRAPTELSLIMDVVK
jgi:predicted Zn-dependent peptidase